MENKIFLWSILSCNFGFVWRVKRFYQFSLELSFDNNAVSLLELGFVIFIMILVLLKQSLLLDSDVLSSSRNNINPGPLIRNLCHFNCWRRCAVTRRVLSYSMHSLDPSSRLRLRQSPESRSQTQLQSSPHNPPSNGTNRHINSLYWRASMSFTIWLCLFVFLLF